MSNLVLEDFAKRLDHCYSRKGMLPVRELSAITDFYKLWRTRPDAESLGLPQWEPSARQINYVNRIFEMLP